MSIVLLQVSEVKDSQLDHPMRSPYCSGETFQRYGGVTTSVRDPRLLAWCGYIVIAVAGAEGRFDPILKGGSSQSNLAVTGAGGDCMDLELELSRTSRPICSL